MILGWTTSPNRLEPWTPLTGPLKFWPGIRTVSSTKAWLQDTSLGCPIFHRTHETISGISWLTRISSHRRYAEFGILGDGALHCPAPIKFDSMKEARPINVDVCRVPQADILRIPYGGYRYVPITPNFSPSLSPCPRPFHRHLWCSG
jgi:hypothetical protein